MADLDRLFVDFQSAVAGRYSLERELGRGGMGIVYLAREVRLDRPVAIKLLPPSKAREAHLRERFLREARTAAKLSHPNIVPIFAVDELADFVFFAMAFIDGETLTERVRRRGPLPASEAARVLREVAWALAYAHSQSLVHRDVKPDNIMLEAATGRALVTDFGIAGMVRGAAGLDGGEVIGTPEFMSPEQALGERVDGRSDLYSLGAVGYFALSGDLPFQGAEATEVLAKQVTEPARPLGVVAGVPRRLAQAIDRCLAKDPADRPQKGEDLAEQLGLALEQRRELPVALRVFVKHNARLGGVGGLLYVLLIPTTMGFVGSLFRSGSMALWTFLALITVVPFGILIGRARRFLQSGFGPEELGAAFRAEMERGREERAFEYGRGPSTYERALRVIGAGGLSIGAVTGFMIVSTPFSALNMFIFQLCGWSLASGILAGFLALVRFERRVDIDTRIWSWAWQGPIGRLLFRTARLFVGSKPLPPPATHRPTELNLALATEQLFSELPRPTRKQLRDLPDVVHRLEQDAGKMRRRLDELQDALGGKGDEGRGTGGADNAIGARHDRIVADLERERDLVQRRLGDAVKALETIRLNLLRLRAGSGSVQSLTTDLGLARQVAQEIGHVLAAEREVDEALR
ncbi:MAG TPA: serine/threonine-protein kinase [Gemmatimonadales bacterium]|nr:serine/threonine-protein kinase [Gemmatimonadales bacterium]